MILVNFPSGQVSRASDLEKIDKWWQGMAGKTPEIHEITGNFNNTKTVRIDSGLPVNNVNISGNTITWSEGGINKNAVVTSITLDEDNNSIKISLNSHPNVDPHDWEFKY